MKSEEDEAFDELARKQGDWGGGFQAKRAAAADKQHWNEDEWRRNNWRCGHGWLRGEQCEICNAPPAPQPAQEPVADRLERLLWEYIDLQAAHPEHKPNPKTWPHLMTYAPLPVQEPQYEFLIDDLADWKQYVEADNAPYGLREHVTKVLLAHGIKEKNK